MKLSDLKRFSVESAEVPGNSGRFATKVIELGEEFHPQSGTQSQKTAITLSARIDNADGVDEAASVEKALERTLSFFERVNGKADIVRAGIVNMTYNPVSESFRAKAQVTMLEHGDGFTHPVVKSLSAFASNKNPDKAEEEALNNVLKLMGEE